MNDTTVTDQHAVINRSLRRLRRLTIASLCVNGLILFLFILGIIAHHHRMTHGGGEWKRGGGRMENQGYRQYGGGMDRGVWGRSGDRGQFGSPEGRAFGRQGFSRQERPNFPRPGMDGQGFGGPGSFGGEGERPHPMGMMGMGGGMADPSKMTDGILGHLSQMLTLTDDQKAKIKPIISQAVAEFQKNGEDRRQAMQKQIADVKVKITPILTADQQKQLSAFPMPGEKPSDAPAK